MNATASQPDLSFGHLNVLALLPCPIKVPLQQAFEQYLADLPPQADTPQVCLEGNANHQLQFYERIDELKHESQLPDILITPGVNTLFMSPFVDRFAQSFASPKAYATDTGVLSDPLERCHMFAANLTIWAIDHERLSNRPVPKRWEDLLDDTYENQLAMRGQEEFFCETVLLNLHKEFGRDAIDQLARAVRVGQHPAEMAKNAGSGRGDAPAISLMPLFFARTIPRNRNVSIVWPEDGAIVSPVTMMVKQSAMARVAPLAQFLAGPEVATLSSKAFFLSSQTTQADWLPMEAPLKWLGWDYLQSIPLRETLDDILERFNEVYWPHKGVPRRASS